MRIQIGATAATYALLVDAFLLLRGTLGERWVIIGLLNTIAHWLTLGSAISFIVSLIAPYRRYWLLYSLPGVVAFVAWYGVLFLPNRPWGDPPVDTQLTASTFNVRQPTSDEFNYAIHAIVTNLDADILGLQEMRKPAFLDSLKAIYPYQYREAPLAILSRYPIIATQTYYYEDTLGETKPVALKAVIRVDQQAISIYVAHPRRPTISIQPLEYDSINFEKGFAVVLDTLHHDDNPIILLCDCNFSSKSEAHAQLAALLTDSWRVAGFGLGLTAPADPTDTPFPIIRSDYIWHSHDLATLEVDVWPDAGTSDHFPVVATLGLRAE